ncbi:MAG: hypothetical protein RLZZ314_8 [Bacteroidota bacterium]
MELRTTGCNPTTCLRRGSPLHPRALEPMKTMTCVVRWSWVKRLVKQTLPNRDILPTMRCTNPGSKVANHRKTGHFKQLCGGSMVAWDFSVDLSKAQMMPGIGEQQTKALQSVTLPSRRLRNVDGHAGPQMPWIQIIQVQRTQGVPLPIDPPIQHPAKLTIAVHVVIPGNEIAHGFSADREVGGTHPPMCTVIFPVVEQLQVLRLHGTQSVMGRIQHGAKIAVPSG